ncbi:MAG: HIT family protein [Dehalococcoidia bacterium]
MTAGERPPGCFLCQKPAEQKDELNLILYRGATAYVVMNLYPYNSGHLLIAPYAHTGDFGTLAPAVAGELIALTQRCARILTDAYRPEGFNAGMNLGAAAGAGEPDHLHVHLVPRWAGDTNFMPVLSTTKVLPETLEQSYQRLRPRFS